MKLSTNEKCTFCNIDTETIEHILYELSILSNDLGTAV